MVIFTCLMGVPAFAQFKNSDEDENAPKTQYSSIIDLLRREPGLVIGGAGTGDMPSIMIRGVGTNSNATQPLFVVDGVFTDNITYIHPDEVYSIEVIKDGTAAIYGMQGANGVIEITTKTKHEEDLKTAAAAKEARNLARESKKLERQAAKEAKKAEKAAAKAAKEAAKKAK